ncbi:DUF2169 domain-containing protein [Nitrosospira sp. Nsp13]|uniref:DUF2169 family type VI secretion system accessory protein n=1 Tax=Nitrosospira sp. Nsp13 TaxID=1855332 RepID=UPI000882568F|nr:DUF2169 domain-containing protein [Nitrosospira sp. Nsp13]SCX77848.1 hypothetical protein SAMN05216308_101150 [Nitrosospira sp. Nsp13]
MWQLDNRTPFAAERTWVRDRNGAEIWLVAVKCTFDIKPDGSTEVAKEQPPVVMAPEYMNPSEPAKSSLKYDMDLVRTKTMTDIVVLGHAHAPHGEPVTELDIGFRVGSVIKRLHVSGDRVWQGDSPSKPESFVKMPIMYERGYGGFDPESKDTQGSQWDMRNPLGTGFALSSSGIDGVKLPNIEYPDQLIRQWDDRPIPAGFGPICAHWDPRARLAGTYDEKWQQNRFPLLPEDFDDRHYQCAPPDQQAPQFLSGGESVTLINLTPGEQLSFELPRIFLGFETFFYTGERQLHERPKLHTVIIEPDFPRVSLVWHTALPCHPKVYKLNKTRIIQKQIVSDSYPQEVFAEADT